MNNPHKTPQYTVVSAVYNVGKYLPRFFQSLISQSIGFEKFIFLILVDDGSTDDSPVIIQQWQQKYPDNILYLRKENGGQASARNLGIKYVKTPWVTFMDPDDFISKNYFQTVHDFSSRQKDISLIICNPIYYFEKFYLYLNRHPLRYRFEQTEYIFPANDLKNNIQLFVNSAFFLTSVIQKNNLTFNPNIRPNFEDGYFVNIYLLYTLQSKVMLLKEAKYYYRKRKDGSSAIDTSWQTPDRYDAVLRYGYLDLIAQYKAIYGHVPKHIQRTVLYDLIWHFRILLKNPEILDILNMTQKKNYHTLLEEIFQDIDSDIISDFELAGVTHYHKLAILYHYKKSNLPYRVVYINKKSKHLLRIDFYTPNETPTYTVSIDDQKRVPTAHSVKTLYFAEKLFLYKHTLDIPIHTNDKLLKMQIDTLPTYFQDDPHLVHFPLDKPYQSWGTQINTKLLRLGRKLILGN